MFYTMFYTLPYTCLAVPEKQLQGTKGVAGRLSMPDAVV